MRQGDHIGAFEIERAVRAGGMGTIYRARDTVSGEAVAVKILPETADDADRFFREARILAELRHPAIVRYVAHGRTPAGDPYLAMEWLEGEDLGERIRGRGLALDESVRVVRRIAEALGEAHARGVVHRDIKPGNVFLPGGNVDDAKLLDFGVARPAGGSVAARLTQTGMLVGTPAYMAPEQVRGSARDLDARGDVFSLGCLLYECLVGRPAFLADNLLGVLARVLFHEPRVAESRPDMPADLDALVARMLAKDPADRPPSALAVIEALDALGHLEGGAPRAPAPATLSAAEKRVVCVVFVGSSGDTPVDTVAERGDEPQLSVGDAQLAEVARRFGARLERVGAGALAAALVSRLPAVDQAADAARLALALRTLLPLAPIAVATGRGVVAESIPVSDAIDRAAGLLELHGPGVWVDPVTAALLTGRFTIDAGGHLEGAREGHEAARLLMGRATPCVGREAELALLDAAYAESVAEPQARAVLVTAPSGVGKSRLRHEWLHRLADRRDPALVLVARGDPMSAGSPFGLAAQAIRQGAGADRAAIERHLGAHPEAARVATFLAEVVGAGHGEPSAELVAARAAPVLMGDQMRLAWEDWLVAETAARPVVLVLEDLHWGDAPSIRLVDAALRTLHDRPLFVLALGRRDVHELFPNLWEERGLREIRLAELSRRASERLVREVLGPAVPSDTVAWIGARAGGNALYLEELIRAAAAGVPGEAPESVLAMVQARLLALPGEARRVLRAASVFGDAFWAGGVAALLGGDAGNLDRWLEDLIERETISRRAPSRFAGHVEHVFRHAIFRDAAYGMLTDGDRTLGHRLAAEWLEGAGEKQPLVLAEHLERGGSAARAIPEYTRAAEEALAGNDFAGALARAERGVACGAEGEPLGRLRVLIAEAHNWRAEEKDAEWAAVQALGLLGRHEAAWYDAARQALSASLPARRELLGRIVEALAEPPFAPDALRAYVRAACVAAQHLLFYGDRAAAGRLSDLVARVAAAAAPDDPLHAWLERTRAFTADFDGAHDLARAAYLRGAACFEAVGDLRNAVSQRVNVGWLEAAELGMPEQAEPTLRHALELAERMGVARSVASAKQNLGVALMRQGRFDEARLLLNETVVAFARSRDRRMEAGSRFYLTTLHTLAGDPARAEEEAQRALGLARDIPTTRACCLAALTFALLPARPAEALAAAEEAQQLLDTLGGIEEGEGMIRLALAEARHAAGQLDGARAAIAKAAARLGERAAKIADPEVRRAFLERQAEHARTLALAELYLKTAATGSTPR